MVSGKIEDILYLGKNENEDVECNYSKNSKTRPNDGKQVIIKLTSSPQ
jgi:hypothetical protein